MHERKVFSVVFATSPQKDFLADLQEAVRRDERHCSLQLRLLCLQSALTAFLSLRQACLQAFRSLLLLIFLQALIHWFFICLGIAFAGLFFFSATAFAISVF